MVRAIMKPRHLLPGKGKGERRYDIYGEFRLMAATEGYVLCRRRGASAVCMTEERWNELSIDPIDEER